MSAHKPIIRMAPEEGNITIETIGPERAKKILRMNTGNFRSIDVKRVNSYAQDIADGKWELTGDTIKITNNVLIDGQHRLQAIIRSGCTIRCAIAYNVAKSAMHLDRGKPRTLGQWLSHLGFKNANAVAACARLVTMHDKNKWTKESMSIDEFSKDEVIEYCNDNKESLLNSVILGNRCKMISRSLSSAIIHIGSGRINNPTSNDTVLWFWEGVNSGVGLDENEPPLVLRNRLIQEKSDKRSLSALYQKMLATMAWNRAAKGETITKSALKIRFSGPYKQPLPEKILIAE